MAVKNTHVKSALTLKYKDGIDKNGKDVIKSKKFSNVKLTAEDQGLYDVATAFNPLMKYPIQEIVRSDDSTLINA